MDTWFFSPQRNIEHLTVEVPSVKEHKENILSITYIQNSIFCQTSFYINAKMDIEILNMMDSEAASVSMVFAVLLLGYPRHLQLLSVLSE